MRCQEFLYSGRCLADDTKNYHAWAHRGAIAEAFGAWERELPIISKMLKEDVRNNSAWSHRFLTLQHLMERQVPGLCHSEQMARGFTAAERSDRSQ